MPIDLNAEFVPPIANRPIRPLSKSFRVEPQINLRPGQRNRAVQVQAVEYGRQLRLMMFLLNHIPPRVVGFTNRIERISADSPNKTCLIIYLILTLWVGCVPLLRRFARG